jgi:hypothetical protein
MLSLERDHSASRNVRLDKPNTRTAGSTVLAFRPIAVMTNRSSLRQLGAGPSHSTTVEADIIPLRSRRLASHPLGGAATVARHEQIWRTAIRRSVGLCNE